MTDARISQTVSETLVEGDPNISARLSQTVSETLVDKPGPISMRFSQGIIEVLVGPLVLVEGDLLNGASIPISLSMCRAITKRI